MDDIKEKFEHRGLMMNSVPSRTKRIFMKLSKEEFGDHYGCTLREILDDYFEYKLIKQLLLNNDISLSKLIKEDK